MRVLISGGNGFVAGHLAEFLLRRGDDVHAFANRDRGLLDSRVAFTTLDITDYRGVRNLMQAVEPREVYHLAAISSVPASWKSPAQTIGVNVIGTYHLLEAACCLPVPPKVLNVSSAQVYAPAESQVDENYPVGPENPYASSKAMAEVLAHQYVRASGLHVVTARPFNHSGPGQSTDFVLPALARQVAQLELDGKPGEISAGSLEAERDFTHVRDVVVAYTALLRDGDSGAVYNVCSGKCQSLRRVVSLLREYSCVPFEVRTDDRKVRRETRRVCGDFTKLNKKTGWTPTITFENLVFDLLSWWRNQLSALRLVGAGSQPRPSAD